MHLDLYTSAFCAPCAAARRVVGEAQRLVPALEVRELDVAAHPDRLEALGIRSTPTIVISGADGDEVFRAAGVPRPDQLLTALARALP
ncbi:thioredoxin family protein [Curtobacterium sp. MCBD17_028]|uniref:glutaredoxin family protein n=1 Tax=Curtobacterium sp. MCBD17_028 TaxID=2175670 RepID=UPI000DA8F1F8|nr:thioredoxin family protein [Curtobacterium sp. MCBD17_028]PZE25622.1 thioredoxin [Curtobacterium sp. MCBD17_028]